MCRSRNIGYTQEAVPREAKIPSQTTRTPYGQAGYAIH